MRQWCNMKLSDFDFRIWDNTKKVFLESNPYIFIIKNDKEKINVDTGIRHKDLRVKDVKGYLDILKPDELDIEIELWTGLYDKNVKKLYDLIWDEAELLMEKLQRKNIELTKNVFLNFLYGITNKHNQLKIYEHLIPYY